MSLQKTEDAIVEIAENASEFSLNCADVAAAVTEVSAFFTAQAETASTLKSSVEEMNQRREEVSRAAGDIGDALSQIEQVSNRSSEAVGDTAAQTNKLIGTVNGLEERIKGLSAALETVGQVSAAIDAIASQTNLLALNATIEAARAGDAGRGFAVVAGEVKKLSGETRAATERINDVVSELSSQVKALIGDIHEGAECAETAQSHIDGLVESLEEMRGVTSVAADCNQRIDAATVSMSEACVVVDEQLEKVAEGTVLADKKLRSADQRLNDLVDFGEKLVQIAAGTEVETADTQYVQIARDTAALISGLFEEAVKKGDVTEDDLFDENYVPVPGTNPEQVTTRFTELTDRLLFDMQEKIVASNDKIVICAAFDRNGYLPTHNKKFSHPQRKDDPAWNAANARNRRMYDDKVALRAGRSRDPFKIQPYRRDMGEGKFVLMKDISAPITVNGRHWGGFRVGVMS
ncbi:methyl-accepting chemotaxis protein [Kordiimonas lipolytica]|uniref:Methyl-accepting chemotaxis protein n=1 Tax=Kordiimonas lipolytica TaxID=1662421 RepID=A0ABV8UCF8_9PROT|nr:methyl-accepting chemotaxis protein [Kordiimonas lipolytica]